MSKLNNFIIYIQFKKNIKLIYLKIESTNSIKFQNNIKKFPVKRINCSIRNINIKKLRVKQINCLFET